MLNVAVPPAESVPVPSVVVPSRNVTEPVAVLGVTVAVNVTLCPKIDGFRDDVKAVEVAVPAEFTVCVRTAEMLAANPVVAT